MAFFKRKKIEGKRGYDIFGTFKYYVPGGSGIFWIIIMFMLGGILGNILTVGMTWIAGPDFASGYGMLISYPVMFVPLLVFASSVSVFAPIFEEWLCRGLVLRGLLQKTNPVAAILISALFFAVIHLNPWQAVPAFILGVLFGIVYYKTGSLKLTMLMHFVNNTFSAILSRIDSLKDFDCFADVMTPGAYWTTFAICVVAVVVICRIFILIQLKDGNKSNCDIIAATDWNNE